MRGWKNMKTLKKDKRRRLGFFVLMLLIVIILAFPLYWMIVTALTKRSALLDNVTVIPELSRLTIENFKTIVESQAQKIEYLSRNNALAYNNNLKYKIISCIPNPAESNVNITTDIDKNVQNAKIIIADISGTFVKEVQILSDTPTVSVNMSSSNPGIYVVSLYVNDSLCDSQRLIKK